MKLEYFTEDKKKIHNFKGAFLVNETRNIKIQNPIVPISSHSKPHSLAEVLQALSMTVTVSYFKACSDHGLTRIQPVNKNRFSIFGQA